jgi:uncharacterized protein YidB (DUF937 family)
MSEFRDVSMEEMNQVEGGFLGSLVDAVKSISTGIGKLVEKGVQAQTATWVGPGSSPLNHIPKIY